MTSIRLLLSLVSASLVLMAGCAPRGLITGLPPAPQPNTTSSDEAPGNGNTGGNAPGNSDVSPADLRVTTAPRVPIDEAHLRDSRTRGAINPPSAFDAPVETAAETVGSTILPLDLNEEVRTRLEYFTEGPGRRTIETGLERAGLYRLMIERVFQEEGIPSDLIYLAQAESAFRPGAISRSDARGIWQFIPARGQEYGLAQNWWVDERSDPEKSTRAAARHLSDLFDQFGDWYLAMAAYNAGPARVARAVESSGSMDFWDLAEQGLLPPETRNYVPTVIAMALVGADPEAYGFDIEPAVAAESARVNVSQQTDLRVIAERLGIALEEIRNLNPHLLRWATPAGTSAFQLILPARYATRFAREVDSLSEEERILFRLHRVSAGETLSQIARTHAVPMSVIAEANALANPDVLRIGQSLAVPLGPGRLPDPAGRAWGTLPDAPPATYRIRPGDTLSGLARRFGIRISEIRSWNSISSNLLIAGEILRMTPVSSTEGVGPPPDEGSQPVFVYYVRPGDTLSSIAAAYRTTVVELRESNLEMDLGVIHPGDPITIPSPGPETDAVE